MARILLVEDELDLARLIADWLSRERHSVEVVADGAEALSLVKLNKSRYELLILDIMLPGASGIEICRAYRHNQGGAPIVMLTAKNSIEEKEQAFNFGADDYITKPFHLKELSVRVSALLRRGVLIATPVLSIRDIVLDPVQRKVTKSGNVVHLRPREYYLLEFLMRHPNQTFSAKEIIDNVWEPDTEAMNDTVRGHVNRLRRKLDDPDKTSLIVNVHGLGYKLETDS